MKQKERRRKRQELIKAIAQKLKGERKMNLWEFMLAHPDWMAGDAVFLPAEGGIIYDAANGKEIARWQKPPALRRSSRK